MMRKQLFYLFIGAGLTACSSVSEIHVQSNSLNVLAENEIDNQIDSIVAPYKAEMEQEMGEVIAHADLSFDKGRPNAALNNWAADAVLHSQIRDDHLQIPVLCLLNIGGLRNSLNEGDIVLGDIFKLMPFDNEIVRVTMPIAALKDVEESIKGSGGEPIAGAMMKGGKLKLNEDYESDRFIIITSDYLMNGGDKMDFFQQKISFELTGVLIRDAMIAEAKRQETLIWNDEKRIELK